MRSHYCDIYYRGYLISIEEEKYLESEPEFSFALKKENEDWDKAKLSNLVYNSSLSVIIFFLNYVDTTLGSKKKEREEK